jgi:hypothetical protein
MNHVEGIQKLTFVLMDSLDVNVKHGLGVDLDTLRLREPGRKTF